jgi:hypothetical protein
MMPTMIPNNPNEAASTINRNRTILIAIDILIEGTTKLEIAVIDTTITIAADTIPASTAACPITNVPTIDIACPIGLGIRIPASLRISNVISIINASMNAGKGVPSR